MQKSRLQADELVVTSFETTAPLVRYMDTTSNVVGCTNDETCQTRCRICGPVDET